MKIEPLDEYKEPEYPQLNTVENQIRSAATSGKKAAAFVMAVAAAMSLTMCGTRAITTDGSQLTEPQTSAANSTRDTTVQNGVTIAGGMLIEETTFTYGTSLAGDIMQTEETSPTFGPEIAGSIVAPSETTLSQAE